MTEKAQPDSHWRRIRSFVRREGRLTAGQMRALNELYPVFGVEYAQQIIDFDVLFGRSAPVVLEIGFGNGASLAQMALANPELNYFGIEVHRPGVGNLLLQLEEQQIENVRVICADAIEVLEHMIGDGSVATVQLFFPDPWTKRRHHKRRIVQPGFVNTIHRILSDDGVYHMATDVENYAKHMMKVMNAASDFENCAGKAQFSERPESRPLTKFEQRGHRLGHGVWDLLFRKITT